MPLRRPEWTILVSAIRAGARTFWPDVKLASGKAQHSHPARAERSSPSLTATTMASTDVDHMNGSDEHPETRIHKLFSPFSKAALALLPKNPQRYARYTRADNIPDAEDDEDGNRPTVRDYHAINSAPFQVRVPKKIATPIKVEAKVWFANERSKSLSNFLGPLYPSLL